MDSNCPFEELVPAGGTAHVRFRLGEAQLQNEAYQWFQEWKFEGEETPWLCFARRGDGYMLRFPGLADFAVTADGCGIECRPLPELPPETMRHLLLDQVLPLALGQTGRCILHASAVAFGADAALVFAGPSGFGKSTLASYLAANGGALLTDDALLLRETGGRLECVPGYPGARLWADSLQALFGPEAATRPYAHYTSKVRLGLEANPVAFGHVAAPLRRLYFLTGPAAGFRAEQLSPREAFLELVRHSFQLDAGDSVRLKANFERFTRLAAQPLFYRLAFPYTWERLQEVGEALLWQAEI